MIDGVGPEIKRDEKSPQIIRARSLFRDGPRVGFESRGGVNPDVWGEVHAGSSASWLLLEIRVSTISDNSGCLAVNRGKQVARDGRSFNLLSPVFLLWRFSI